MAKIKNMLLFLCVIGFLSATMCFSMYMYVRGRYEIFTHLSKYMRVTDSHGDMMDLQENSTSSVAQCNLTNNSLLGNIGVDIHFDVDPPSWEEIIQEYQDIIPGMLLCNIIFRYMYVVFASKLEGDYGSEFYM